MRKPPEQFCVYRIYYDDGTLIYVGQTANRWARLDTHRRGGGLAWTWWPWPMSYTLRELVDAGRITFEEHPDRASAERAERRAIARESPLANLVGARVDGDGVCWKCHREIRAWDKAGMLRHVARCPGPRRRRSRWAELLDWY